VVKLAVAIFLRLIRLAPGSIPGRCNTFFLLFWSGLVVLWLIGTMSYSCGRGWGSLVGDTIDLSMAEWTVRTTAVLVLELIHFAIILRLWW
jgi:hypothetical protein